MVDIFVNINYVYLYAVYTDCAAYMPMKVLRWSVLYEYVLFYQIRSHIIIFRLRRIDLK